MTAIRLGRERLTAVSNGFADLISDTGGSTPAIPNGFLNGSVFGNDMGSLSAHYTGRLLNNRGAVQFGLPRRAPCLATPRAFGCQRAAIRQAHRQTSTICFRQLRAGSPSGRQSLPLRETSRCSRGAARRLIAFYGRKNACKSDGAPA